MKYRLLLIMFLSIICTAFTGADDRIFNSFEQDVEISDSITPSCLDSEITTPSNDLIAARQNNFTTNSPTRTVSKRTSSGGYRTLVKYLTCIFGKIADRNFVEFYQVICNLMPSGLSESHRHLISLGKLII
jgi:hypothetical protein